jgi:hypothetical protein
MTSFARKPSQLWSSLAHPRPTIELRVNPQEKTASVQDQQIMPMFTAWTVLELASLVTNVLIQVLLVLPLLVMVSVIRTEQLQRLTTKNTQILLTTHQTAVEHQLKAALGLQQCRLKTIQQLTLKTV